MSAGNEDVIVDSKSIIGTLLCLSSEWLESRRKLDKDWVNKFKGVTLKYQDIVKSAKEKKYSAVTDFLQSRDKGKKSPQPSRLQLLGFGSVVRDSQDYS